MRKLPEELECPVDNWIYIVVEYIAPYFHQWGWTPNMITTLSIMCALLSAYCIYTRNFVMASIAFFLSYVFDCLDGYVARKYDEVTVFGDYYDHFSDVGTIILICFFLWRINARAFCLVFIVYLIMLIPQCVHLGYQELYYDKPNESGFLHTFTYLCENTIGDKIDVVNRLQYTRYFGCGTVYLYIAAVLMFYGSILQVAKNPRKMMWEESDLQ